VDQGFIKHTQDLFLKKFGHYPSEEEVRVIGENMCDFFDILAEWKTNQDGTLTKGRSGPQPVEKSRKTTSWRKT
jgi:hypothetical protein